MSKSIRLNPFPPTDFPYNKNFVEGVEKNNKAIYQLVTLLQLTEETNQIEKFLLSASSSLHPKTNQPANKETLNPPPHRALFKRKKQTNKKGIERKLILLLAHSFNIDYNKSSQLQWLQFNGNFITNIVAIVESTFLLPEKKVNLSKFYYRFQYRVPISHSCLCVCVSFEGLFACKAGDFYLFSTKKGKTLPGIYINKQT